MESNKAIVYIADIKDTVWDGFYDRFKDLIEPKRLERINSVENEKSKKMLICTGALLQGVLKLHGGDAHDIAYDENGKPFLQGKTDLFFNVSHSGTLIVVAVAGCEIGVDIQKPVPYKEALINRICGMEERDSLGSAVIRNFNLVWAVKESFTKLTGTGIARDLKEITFVRNGEEFDILEKGEKAAKGYHVYADELYETVLSSKEPINVENVITMNL